MWNNPNFCRDLSHDTLTSDDNTTTNDRIRTVAERDPNVFNKYVNPKKPEALWNIHATKAHGLLPSDPRIMNADTIDIVWQQFGDWINQQIPDGKYGIVVAWNGATCDLKWIWKLTQAPFSRCSMPTKLKYFMDPYRVIDAYSSCPINKKKSKLDSYELGCVWKYLDSEHNNLNGAHLSGQVDIIYAFLTGYWIGSCIPCMLLCAILRSLISDRPAGRSI